MNFFCVLIRHCKTLLLIKFLIIKEVLQVLQSASIENKLEIAGFQLSKKLQLLFKQRLQFFSLFFCCTEPGEFSLSSNSTLFSLILPFVHVWIFLSALWALYQFWSALPGLRCGGCFRKTMFYRSLHLIANRAKPYLQTIWSSEHL